MSSFRKSVQKPGIVRCALLKTSAWQIGLVVIDKLRRFADVTCTHALARSFFPRFCRLMSRNGAYDSRGTLTPSLGTRWIEVITVQTVTGWALRCKPRQRPISVAFGLALAGEVGIASVICGTARFAASVRKRPERWQKICYATSIIHLSFGSLHGIS